MATKPTPKPAPPPIAGAGGYIAATKGIDPPDRCYVCDHAAPVMLTVQVRDGERKVCSKCWRRDYRC